MLTIKDNLKASSLEFNRMQELLKKKYLDIFSRFVRQYGIIMNEIVGFDQWEVSKYAATSIKIKAGEAILLDSNSYAVPAKLSEDLILAMPTADGTYKVAIRHAVSNYETGTIDLTGNSTSVTGTDTEFTKICAANRSLIIGNEVIKIDTVNSDTSLTLVTPYPYASKTNQKFAIGGYFTTEQIGAEDNKIYEHDAYEIVIKTAALESYEYKLADVTIASSDITVVTDNRENITLQLSLAAPVKIQIPHTFTINNEVKVAAGDLHNIIPFFVGKPGYQTIKITKAIHKIRTGTSATVKIQQNGIDLTELSNIAVTTAKTTTTLTTPVSLADADEIKMIVTAVDTNPMDLSFSLIIEYLA